GEVVGVVLEVGVHDRRELPPGLLEPRPDGRALAHVALVLEEAHALWPLAAEQELAGAVGGSVVHDDELEVGVDLRIEDLADRAFGRGDLVEDRHQDRQLGRVWHYPYPYQ